MQGGSGQVARKHPVVNQRRQHRRLDLQPLKRLGHAVELRQHCIQCHFTACEVVKQIAGRQVELGSQAQSGIVA